MNGTVLALIVLLLALGSTYFFCVRPMRKGNCAMGQDASCVGAASKDLESGTEAARLKSEIAALRTQSARPGSE